MNISNDLPLINTRRQRNTAGRSLSRRGIAALEFALVAPLFLVLVFGIVVYGIYFATWIVVTEAASEGARARPLRDFPRLSGNRSRPMRSIRYSPHMLHSWPPRT